MFKFMKNKKGFTLVELMIVVVIMAILVAVAVPIFSSVTSNARFKTCAGNRREIVSQVNSYMMGSVDGMQHFGVGDFTIRSNGKNGTYGAGTTAAGTDGYTEELLNKLFQALPYCPVKGGVYTVSVSATGTITVACNVHTNATGVENEKESSVFSAAS